MADENQAGAAGSDIRAQIERGFDLLRRHETELAMAQFDSAIEAARALGDRDLQVHCLVMKSLAYQEAKRLHEAFGVVNQILELADAAGDLGIRCDALISQAQILLDSGEPPLALQKLDEARKLAIQLSDKRRHANVLGVLGNHSIAVTSLDLAEAYFDKAARLATELGDSQARYGYLGNKASALAWQGNYGEAIPEFEQVLEYVRQVGERGAEIQALRSLAQAHNRLIHDEQALAYAQQGIGLSREANDETLLTFYEVVLTVYYRQGRIADAQATSRLAADLARELGNAAREFDFQLSLAEAQFLSDLPAEAYGTYGRALELAKQLERRTDQAYLTGRLGTALAELGRLDEAIQRHEEALDAARMWAVPALEGEQLTMLALAHAEKGDPSLAQEYCLNAIRVYKDAGLSDDANKAAELLERLGLSPAAA